MKKVINLNTEKTGMVMGITEAGKTIVRFEDGTEKEYAESTFKRWFREIEVEEVEINNVTNSDEDILPIEDGEENEFPSDISDIAKDLYLALKAQLPTGVNVKHNPTYNIFSFGNYSYVAVEFQKRGINIGLNPEYLDEEVLEKGKYFPKRWWAIKFHIRVSSIDQLNEWMPTIIELGIRIKEAKGL